MKKLRWLNQNLSLSIPVFLVLGLIAGLLFPVQGLSVLIAPLTLLMVYPMMVGLRPKQAARVGPWFGAVLGHADQLPGDSLCRLWPWPAVFCRPARAGAGSAADGIAADQRHDHLLDRFCQGQCAGGDQADHCRPVPGFFPDAVLCAFFARCRVADEGRAGVPADPDVCCHPAGGRPADQRLPDPSLWPGQLPEGDWPELSRTLHSGRTGHCLCRHGVAGEKPDAVTPAR